MIRLKELRTEAGYSQVEVASKLGITQQAYANYERGARQADYESLKKLSEIFGVSVDYILDKESDSAEEIKEAQKRTKELYEEADPNINDLEKALGVNYASFRTWYNGIGDCLNNKISSIADFFGVSTDYLFGRTDERSNVNDELKGVAFALYKETKDLTDGEKQDILDYIRFKKQQNNK